MSFKQYGEWLFEDDRSSIIYEKRGYLTENQKLAFKRSLIKEGFSEGVADTILTMTQLGLSGLSLAGNALLPGIGEVATAANIAISFGREDWLGVVLGIIGLVPYLGDAGEIVGRFLQTLRAPAVVGALTGSRAASAAGALGSALRSLPGVPTIVSGIERVIEFVARYSGQIIAMFQRAINSAGGGSAAARALTAGGGGSSSILQSIEQLLNSGPIQRILRSTTGTTIINGLRTGFNQLTRLLNYGLDLLRNRTVQRAITGEEIGHTISNALSDEESSEERSGSKPAVVAEGLKYTDIRFKKLAGIK